GAVRFGLIVDGKLVPNPDAIIERFAPEFEKLLLIALMEDWEQPITAADAAATLAHHAGAAKKATGATAPRHKRGRRKRAKLAPKPSSAFAAEMRRFRGRTP
ncbi:MAG TPA: hypothetical protein VFO79_17355, partial [Xanthomonadales bacterium]|nr:hypothetical protein [Xanthomonadales bacterium]